MRRSVLACLILLGATAAFAANPYYLDRNGVLWKGTAAPEGLVLTGELNGSEVVHSVVPFPLALPPSTAENGCGVPTIGVSLASTTCSACVAAIVTGRSTRVQPV